MSRWSWALTCSAALLGVSAVVAGPAETGTQPSKSTSQSAVKQTAAPSVKVTVVKSTTASSANTAAGSTAKKSSTDTSATSTPQATSPAQRRTHSNAPAAPAMKPGAARPAPVPPRPQAAPTPAPARQSEISRQTPAPTSDSTITVEGSIAELDLKAVPPTVRVTSPFGHAWTMTIDPATSSIVKGGRVATLEDLQVRDGVKVVYSPRNGARLVKAIEIKQ